MIKFDIPERDIVAFLKKHDKITYDVALEEMNKQKRNEILKQHTTSIWKAKDGRWKARVKDSSKKEGRRIIAKSSKEDLEDALIEFYTNQEEKKDEITLKNLYAGWQNYKRLNGCQETTIMRINSDWKSYYLPSNIINIPLTQLDTFTVKIWILEMIQNVQPTKTKYYNIISIIRQMLEYACEKQIIQTNPFIGLKIDTKKLLQKNKKPDSSTQVFFPDEVEMLFKWAMEDFENRTKIYELAPLALIFQLQTGLRIGELCAVKYDDIECIDNIHYLHVQRMLQRDTKKILDHTKTNAGDRFIPLSEEALQTIKLAKERQKELGNNTDGYIFSSNGKILTERSVSDLYRKYCSRLGGPMRSSHKSRKTVVSKLINDGIGINSVRDYAGHSNERTTLYNYCFNSKPLEEVSTDIINSLSWHK